MRRFLVMCILTAVATDAFTHPSSRKNWPYIKNLIATRFFGKEGAVVIQQTEIPKNKTYQLFQLKGHDDFLINLTRRPEMPAEKVKVPTDDPVIVNPEVAIIGNFLGTKTQGETLLAIEVTKNLLKSGILSGERGKLTQEDTTPCNCDKNNIKKAKQLSDTYSEENLNYIPSVSAQSEEFRSVNPNDNMINNKSSNRDWIVTKTRKPTPSEHMARNSTNSDGLVVRSTQQQAGIRGNIVREPMNYTPVVLTPHSDYPSTVHKKKQASQTKTKISTKTDVVTSTQNIPKELPFLPPLNGNLPSLNMILSYLMPNQNSRDSGISFNGKEHPKSSVQKSKRINNKNKKIDKNPR